MEPVQNSRKEIYIGLAASILLLLMVGGLYFFTKGRTDKVETVATSTEITILPSEKVSDFFPQGMYLPPDAQILNLYTGNTKDNKIQSTLIYTSRMPIEKNIASTTEYFQKEGWSPVRPYYPSRPGFAVYKDNQRMTIEVSPQTDSKSGYVVSLILVVTNNDK